MFGKVLKFISNIVLPQIIVVGLDIEEDQIAGVARTNKYGVSTVVATNVFPLSKGAIVNGELKNPDELKEAVKALIKKIPTGEKELGAANEPIFVLSIPPNHLYTETVIIPSMSDEDLLQSVNLKIETSLPWPKDQSYSDWNKVAIDEERGVGAFIAGTSKPILDQYFKVFLENGWKVGACEFHLFSLARVINSAGEKPFIFVLIGEGGVELAVYAFGSIISHDFEVSLDAAKTSSLIEDKVRQLTSYVSSNYGVIVEKIFIFDRVQMEKTSSELSSVTGIPAQTFVPNDLMSGLEPKLFVAYEAAGRPYSSSEPALNLKP